MNLQLSNKSHVNDSFAELYQFVGSVQSAMNTAVHRVAETGASARPELVAGVAAAGLAAVALLLAMAICIVSSHRRRTRLRENALAVRIAQNAPEDDRDEHEFETRNNIRGAAPGDSDAEEDPAVTKAGKPIG